VATREHEVGWLEEAAEAARAHGEDVLLLDREATRAEVDSPTYLAGLWQRGSNAMVDPARLAWGYEAIYHFRNGVARGLEEHRPTFELLARNFARTFPQMEGIRFTHRWAGAIDTCSRFCVTFGRALGGRAAYAVGYTGLGVGASRFGARASRSTSCTAATPS
jgi:hypothetical protein